MWRKSNLTEITFHFSSLKGLLARSKSLKMMKAYYIETLLTLFCVWMSLQSQLRTL